MLVCSRHWKEVMRITGKELNLAEDVFKLQHLLDCKLLKVRDDMEELTNSAVKEEQIETKLATVGLDWAEQNLVFSDYKTRGPVILKASCAALCIKASCMHCSLMPFCPSCIHQHDRVKLTELLKQEACFGSLYMMHCVHLCWCSCSLMPIESQQSCDHWC